MRFCIFVVISLMAVPPHASGQENVVESSRELLCQSSSYFNYPGGMLFHTAFHHALTTRYVLLKSAKQCPALKQYLKLNANQMESVDKLRPLHVETPSKKAATDLNAEPDEQVLDSNYFDFLNTEQLARLDLVAFRFERICCAYAFEHGYPRGTER